MKDILKNRKNQSKGTNIDKYTILVLRRKLIKVSTQVLHAM